MRRSLPAAEELRAAPGRAEKIQQEERMAERNWGTQRVSFDGADGVRLAGDRWDPVPAAGEPAGTVLLLHGGGQTRHSWRRTAQRLASAGWTAITVDARGHGDSQWAPDADYSLDAFVRDLYAITDTLDAPPAIIGASLGGMTALVGQGERSTMASALVLVDITPRIEPAGRARIHAFMSGAPDGFASLDEVADAVHAYNPRRSRPRNLEGLKKNVRQHENGRWYWHWDPRFLQIGDEPARAVDASRVYRAARNVTIPTLLVRGTESDIVTAEGAAEFLSMIPSATLVEVAAGHMVAGDDNDVFSRYLRQFLASRVRTSGYRDPAGQGTG
jgi:pimeloyl-ACP methyl ester carboxylesterase